MLRSSCDASPLAPRLSPPETEQFIVRQWTTADGLPINYVGNIVQGDDGYLWLTGGGGLVRFDGSEFKVFTREDIPGWQTSFVQRIHKGTSGALWLVSRRGTLTRYHEGQFHTYEWTAPIPMRVRFYDGGDGSLWIGSGNQIARVEGKTIEHFLIEGGRPNSEIKGFYEDDRGTLWSVSSHALLRRQGDRFVATDLGHSFYQITNRQAGGVWAATSSGLVSIEDGRLSTYLNDTVRPDTIFSLHEDRAGHLWIGLDGGRLVRKKGSKETVYTRADGLPGPINNIFEMHDGQIWVKSPGNGLAYLSGGRFEEVKLHEGRSPPVSALHLGPEGNIWMGTGTGLFSLTPRTINGYTQRDGLPADLIFPILQDRKGTVWLGTTGGGLHRLDGRGGSGPKATITTADGLPSNSIRSLHAGRNGNLWVGAGNGYVARLSDDGAVTQTRRVSQDGETIRALYQDRRDRLWIGAKNLFLLEGDSLRRYGPDRLSRGNTRIRAIHEDQTGTTWVTSREGLFRKKNGSWRRFTTEDGLPSNFVMAIHEDADGTLWFTTHGAGLVRYDGDGAFFTYTTADGLYNNGVWQILDDGLGHYWMSSNTGIFRVSKQELERFRNGEIDRIRSDIYTVADGMPSSECAFTQPGGWKTQDGRLWFPTIKGAAIVDPTQVRADSRAPPVRMQEVRADGREVDWRRAGILQPGKGNLAFHFAALSFSAPERTRYRYTLEGYDETWQRAGARRAAFYTNLPPGQYRFRVQARTGGSAWSQEEAAFTFTLQPHFWQTPWFYLLCIGGLMSVVYGAHWVRLRRMREQNLERTVEARTRALREEKETTEKQAQHLEALREARSRLLVDLAHELRTPLTLISGPVRSALDEGGKRFSDATRDQLEVALRNAERAAGLVGRVKELARLETGGLELEPRTGDLVTFARKTARSFEPMAERKGLTLRFRADEEKLPCQFDPDKLQSVLGNLVENALKFTPKDGKVLVRVGRTDEETAFLRVSDTGPGIPEDEIPRLFDRFHRGKGARAGRAEGTGLGLALVKELIELHGGTIEVDSELGMGSTFTACLPVQTPERPDQPSGQEEGAGMDAGPEEQDAPEIDVHVRASDRLPGTAAPKGNASVEGPDAGQSIAGDSRPRLLIVEDNADVQLYLRHQLSEGFAIETAEDGAEALEKARAARPDLVLSDVMMPEMDGVELCQRIKADDQLCDLPVVLLTAKAGEQAQVEGLGAGADAYVEKPFSMESLRVRIDALIDSRASLRDQYSEEIVVQPSEVSITPEEQALYEEACAVVEAHIGDPAFDVGMFASEMGEAIQSKSQLRRKLKAATGHTPNVFIRHMRLERAAQLLQQDDSLRVYEVARKVGYRDADYFSRRFREHFGVSPSVYSPEKDNGGVGDEK